jgi:hypothetical protein
MGQRPEISFDTVLKGDNAFVEGCYRLPGAFWQVVIFQKAEVPDRCWQPSVWKKPTTWEGEIGGIVIRFPRESAMSRDALMQAMCQAVGYEEWAEVEGPDSTMLR